MATERLKTNKVISIQNEKTSSHFLFHLKKQSRTNILIPSYLTQPIINLDKRSIASIDSCAHSWAYRTFAYTQIGPQSIDTQLSRRHLVGRTSLAFLHLNNNMLLTLNRSFVRGKYIIHVKDEHSIHFASFNDVILLFRC